MITEQLMRRMWPNGDEHIPGLRKAIAETSERVFQKYGITTPLQVAHLMAQVSHECGAGHDVVENLSYSARRMTQVWPSRFPSVASAIPYANNPRKLANNVYGSRMGNHRGTDDGYNFRGRGASQTTGRDGYARLAQKTGLDLLNDPDLVNDPDHFLECGVADFIICGCLPYCSPKPGLPDGDIRGVTHHLNGGYVGLSQRQAWFAKWKAALRTAPVALVAEEPEAHEDADDGILRYGSSGFEVGALQGQLSSLGYHIGAKDSDFGASTRAAVLGFQADNNLPTTGEVDPATKSALNTAPPKPISEDRAAATADDLREGGSSTVKAADHLTFWGKAAAALGLGGGTAEKSGLLDTVRDSTDQFSAFRGVIESVQDLGHWALSYWWVFAIIGGIFVVKFGCDIINRRVEDHRSAANIRY